MRAIDGRAIAPGDVVIGVASSGLHSNGFSLVRQVVFDRAGLGVDDQIDELGTSVGEALLTPTQIYARPIRKILNHYKVKNVIHGIAHITGGGLQENMERILPSGTGVRLRRDSWPVPVVFNWLKRLGNIDQEEMDRVFNGGIGLALLVSSYYADKISTMLSDAGLVNWRIGEVVAGIGDVTWGDSA